MAATFFHAERYAALMDLSKAEMAAAFFDFMRAALEQRVVIAGEIPRHLQATYISLREVTRVLSNIDHTLPNVLGSFKYLAEHFSEQEMKTVDMDEAPSIDRLTRADIEGVANRARQIDWSSPDELDTLADAMTALVRERRPGLIFIEENSGESHD